MKQYQEVHRTLAALAWCKFPDDFKAAAGYFKDCLASMRIKSCPADAKDFIKNWGSCWDKNGNLQGKGSNSGRDRLLIDEFLERFLQAIINWAAAGEEGPYSSLPAVLRAHPELKAELEATGASHETLRNSLKRYCPTLVYKNLWVKQKLTDKHKEKRYDAVSTKMYEIAHEPKLLERVVYIDAKTMYMTVKSRRGWVLVGQPDIFEAYHPASEKNPITLKYYIAVNYKVGKVKLIWYTGTTGMAADRNPDNPYLVSERPAQAQS